MHTYQFYIPSERIIDGQFFLEGDEFRHCCRVLRKNAGEKIDIFNGYGRRWSAQIDSIDRNQAKCRILDEYPPQPRLQPEIILGVGLLKSNLIDEIVVNATALGVTDVVPLLSVHAVKNKINRARLQKLTVTALKQSGLAWISRIHECLSLAEWFDLVRPVPLKMIAEQFDSLALNRVASLASASQVAVMIGPEGGFSESEMEQARQVGFTAVNIFPYRLRTELAATVAIAGIRSLTLAREAYSGN
ncbi:MAG: RsmE family RNA methyltransferase [Candidatus Neomarinimicrobiota bacterium]